MNDNQLGQFPYYSIYHCDRRNVVGNNVNHSVRGGSLLIAIKSHLHSYLILLQNYNIGQLYIKLSIGSLILLIWAVNISPQSDINVYNTHTDTVNNLLIQYCNSKIIVLGYYNLPGLHWLIVENNIIIGVKACLEFIHRYRREKFLKNGIYIITIFIFDPSFFGYLHFYRITIFF